MDNLTLSAIIKNNIGLKNLEEDGATIPDDILALQTSKQDKLIAGNNIIINADGKTINAVSGDIVIYDNASGANAIAGIALDIGATYEMFTTSAFAFDGTTNTQYGQQKITIKLIPAEPTPNNYDLYMPILYFNVGDSETTNSLIHIYKYETELWSVDINTNPMKIYKIVKKAV